jgi:glucose/mannose transport system permease protein
MIREQASARAAGIARAERLSTGARLRRSVPRIVTYLLLLLFAAFYLMPIYVLLVTGLKSFAEVNLETMWGLPSSISFDSFVQAFERLRPNLENSIKLAIPATLLSALLGSLNGYVLSKWRFRGSDVLFTAVLFGMFIPYQSILIPLVGTLQEINRAATGVPEFLQGIVPGYGSIAGLVLIHVVYGIPITTLIFRNYYATVPGELVEAARIDGASFFGIYRHIMFPISMPGFVVVLIWQFTSIWNEFLFAVVVTNNPSAQPITVALNNLAGSFIVEWNVQMAGALLAALPTLIIYIVLGRYFIRGLLSGALKG